MRIAHTCRPRLEAELSFHNRCPYHGPADDLELVDIKAGSGVPPNVAAAPMKLELQSFRSGFKSLEGEVWPLW